MAKAVAQRGIHLALAAACLLAACGGGSGGGEPPTPPPAPAPVPPLSERCETNSVARLDTEPLNVGRSAELHLLACSSSGALSQLRWSSTGPSNLSLLSQRSPSLSFTPSQSGLHRFSVSFTDAQGRSHSGSIELNAAANDLPRGLLTRGEPSVWGGGRFSLRAWPLGYTEAELSGSSTRWERVSGPDMVFSENTGERAVATAPSVTQDQIAILRATLSWPDGRSVQDEFRLLVQPPPSQAPSPLFTGSSAATRVYPYQESGPQAAALARCVYTPALQWNPNNLCTLAELPLLGQSGPAPSVEQVMQRVLVSHDWQGEVFERFLREQDSSGDFRRMLAATTAVVIGGRIRPAFYWSTTGAIYLDASYLWLTPEQRDTLSEAPDPRSDFGRDLQYSSPWRYVKDNQFATPARPVALRGTRELAEIRVELGRLLYHELAHAADFLPPRVHASLNSSRKVFEAVPAQTPSLSLQQQQPFFSQEMVGLGKVNFFGESSSATQRSYRPEDVVTFFSNDRVNDDYAYALPSGQSVPREDAAMLIEEALVALRYGVQRDFGITPRVPDNGSSADQLLVWGQRGRIGDAALRTRLQLVLGELMPWIPASELDRLPRPLQLRAGLTWGQNLDQGAVSASRPRPLNQAERQRDAELERERRLLRH